VRKKIGECLIQAGLIIEEDLQVALAEHQRTRERIGSVLVRLNFATEKQIARALAFQLGLPCANLIEEPPDPRAIVLIAREVAAEHICVGFRVDQKVLTVAASDPLPVSLVHDLERQTGRRIRQVVATRSEILSSIEQGYAAVHDVEPGEPVDVRPWLVRREDDTFEMVQPAAPRGGAESMPIVDLADLVIDDAITGRASDVYIEPHGKGVLVRHRLDGTMKQVLDLPKWVHAGLVARIKSMAGLDVGQTRKPQEGTLRARQEDGTGVDFRVSTTCTVHGEKIVVRVVDQRKGTAALEALAASGNSIDAATPCPGCAGAIAADFMVCPHCGHRLKAGCGSCGRALQPEWLYCPSCAASQARPSRKRLREQAVAELPLSNVAEFKNSLKTGGRK
jgi:type IV pilus assembly protein PilB